MDLGCDVSLFNTFYHHYCVVIVIFVFTSAVAGGVGRVLSLSWEGCCFAGRSCTCVSSSVELTTYYPHMPIGVLRIYRLLFL